MIRRRFREVVRRQLDLVTEDEAELFADADAALASWRSAGRDEAEEAYGDYQLAADAIADRLLELREAYAATVDEAGADEYRRELGRAVSRRFRAYPSVVSDLAER